MFGLRPSNRLQPTQDQSYAKPQFAIDPALLKNLAPEIKNNADGSIADSRADVIAGLVKQSTPDNPMFGSIDMSRPEAAQLPAPVQQPVQPQPEPVAPMPPPMPAPEVQVSEMNDPRVPMRSGGKFGMRGDIYGGQPAGLGAIGEMQSRPRGKFGRRGEEAPAGRENLKFARRMPEREPNPEMPPPPRGRRKR